jgi:GntR family transcriptional regulator
MSSSPTSLYAQVEEVLTAEVASGELSAGAQLPSEDSLVERFKVSRTTVRKAIQNLIGAGVVEIRRGKGTFVAQPRITQELTELSGFVEDMKAVGRRATARLVDQRVVAATEIVARQLALATGTRVVRIQRVRLANGVAVSFDETFLPLDIGQKIITNDLESQPIFELLEQKYGIPLIDAEYKLEAVGAEAVVASALGVEAGSPIFLIERTSYRGAKQPIDYERLHYRGDMVRFVTRLARRRVAPEKVKRQK